MERPPTQQSSAANPGAFSHQAQQAESVHGQLSKTDPHATVQLDTRTQPIDPGSVNHIKPAMSSSSSHWAISQTAI